MGRKLRLGLLAVLWAGCVQGQVLGKLQGWAEDGNATVTTAGVVSTSKVQKSYPSATVTVYLPGTTTTVSIFADATGTGKANPFTLTPGTGQWFFYAPQGCYDIKFSGTGIAAPFTLGNQCVSSSAFITNYGAKCDGSTDDTAAFTAAIAAPPKNIIIPSGRTCITGPVSINVASKQFTSDGTGTIKVKSAQSASATILAIAANGIIFDRLIFDGNVSGQTNRSSLIYDAGGHSGVQISNSTFQNGLGYAVQGTTAAVSWWTVNNNVFDAWKSADNQFAFSLNASATNTRITGNKCKTINGQTTIGGCIQVRGISGGGSSNVIVSENTFDGVTDIPMEINVCTNCTIDGNVIQTSGSRGISTAGMVNSSITGNVVKDQTTTPGYCIEFGTATGTAVVGNTCNNDNYGIEGFTGPSSNVTVTGNVLRQINYTGGATGNCLRADSWTNFTISGNLMQDCLAEGMKISFNGSLGNAGGADGTIADNTIIFTTSRAGANAALAIEINTYARMHVTGNTVYVATAGSPGTNNGVINVGGTCPDMKITGNHLVAGDGSPADMTGIRVVSSATVAGLQVQNNYIHNFAKGYYDQTGTTITSAYVTPNTMVGVTVPYTVLTTDYFNPLGDPASLAAGQKLFYDSPAAQNGLVDAPLFLFSTAAKNGLFYAITRRDSTATLAAQWQIGGCPSGVTSDVCLKITNASFDVADTGGVEHFRAGPNLRCDGGATLTTVMNGVVRIMSGAGSPASAVNGNVGDLYINTSGGAGTTLYVKESGACTTAGWAAK